MESKFDSRAFNHSERKIATMDASASRNLWKNILSKLPTESTEELLDHRQHIKLWTNGDEILGKHEERIEGIADLLETMGFDVNTGYYDPEEDARNHEVDRNTGYYYVTIC